MFQPCAYHSVTLSYCTFMFLSGQIFSCASVVYPEYTESYFTYFQFLKGMLGAKCL